MANQQNTVFVTKKTEHSANHKDLRDVRFICVYLITIKAYCRGERLNSWTLKGNHLCKVVVFKDLCNTLVQGVLCGRA